MVIAAARSKVTSAGDAVVVAAEGDESDGDGAGALLVDWLGADVSGPASDPSPDVQPAMAPTSNSAEAASRVIRQRSHDRPGDDRAPTTGRCAMTGA